MTVVTVTMTLGTTCHYWLSPRAKEDTTGLGVTVPSIVHGWQGPNNDGSSSTLTLQLDNAYTWDVIMTFRNAPPVFFPTFNPGNGGDLLTLLGNQGWMSL